MDGERNLQTETVPEELAKRCRLAAGDYFDDARAAYLSECKRDHDASMRGPVEAFDAWSWAEALSEDDHDALQPVWVQEWREQAENLGGCWLRVAGVCWAGGLGTTLRAVVGAL